MRRSVLAHVQCSPARPSHRRTFARVVACALIAVGACGETPVAVRPDAPPRPESDDAGAAMGVPLAAKATGGVNLPTARRPAALLRSLFDDARLTPPRRLTLATYDGSGHSVHPDLIYRRGGWNGWECWLAYTPYPQSNAALENPSIAVSHNCETWSLLPGRPNPVVPPPTAGYNSDPDLELDEIRDRLVMVYRVVAGRNVLRLIETADGVTWSAPTELFSAPNHDAVSPSLVIPADGGLAKLWYVEAGRDGCRSRATRVLLRTARPAPGTGIVGATWSPPRPVALAEPGKTIWHLAVHELPRKLGYLAIYSAHPTATVLGCGDEELYLAWSADGLSWRTVGTPLIQNTPELRVTTLYRATLAYEPKYDRLRIIYSAYDVHGRWSQFSTAYRYSRVMGAFGAPVDTTAQP